MENTDFFDDLEKFLEQGEIDTVIEQLLSFLKTNEVNFKSERSTIIVISGNYHSLKKEIDQQTIPDEQKRINLARIRVNLKSFIDSIKKKGKLIYPINSPKIGEPISIPKSAYEKIIGEKSNIKKIAWLLKGLQMEKSICRVVNSGYGTGFIIEGEWLITNHHVISTANEAQETEIQFNFNEDEKGKLLVYHSYKLDSSQFISDEALDFTRVKIIDNEQNPLSNWGHLKLSDKAAQIDDHVTIIQHPSGGPKQIALTDNKVINIFQDYIQYTTDTLPGSSGSPVFNDDWEVIGLHHAGGDLQKNDAGEKVFANQAISMKKILEFLEKNG